jgi:hypothetical protein
VALQLELWGRLSVCSRLSSRHDAAWKRGGGQDWPPHSAPVLNIRAWDAILRRLISEVQVANSSITGSAMSSEPPKAQPMRATPAQPQRKR